MPWRIAAARIASPGSTLKERPLGCTVIWKGPAGVAAVMRWVSSGSGVLLGTSDFALKPEPARRLAQPFPPGAGAGGRLRRRRPAARAPAAAARARAGPDFLAGARAGPARPRTGPAARQSRRTGHA